MDIYPSVLEQSADSLLAYITENTDLFSHFQIDIADGIFVQNTTVSAEHLAEHIAKNPPLLPIGTTCEFHLMVENFAEIMPHLETITQYLPISEVLVHFQPAMRWTQGFDQDLHELLHDQFPFTFGLSINPEVEILENYNILLHFPVIQIMTIQPGGQGRPLIPDTLDKITELRENGFSGRILLDGAMNAKNFPLVLAQSEWPDAICPGSYLKEKTQERLEELQRILFEETP